MDLKNRWARVRRRLRRVPGLVVLVNAARNYIAHQSANQAGSIAFSTVVAMFPLLILAGATAAYIGRPGDAAAMADKVLSYAPPMVREALLPVVDEVLGRRSQALLTIGVLVTLWTASSGMQAVRMALNRAYGVVAAQPFWKARIKVTVFTVVVGIATTVAFGWIVIAPNLFWFLREQLGIDTEMAWLRAGVRYAIAYVVLAALYALLYGWLPDISQRLRTVMPGALFGAAMWVGAAALLSTTLRSAGRLILVYGSFAGLVATLVFLYVSAATLIFGAEINAVLRKRGRDGAGTPPPPPPPPPPFTAG